MSEGPIAPRLIVPSRIKRDPRFVQAASCARISCEHCDGKALQAARQTLVHERRRERNDAWMFNICIIRI